jgi:hypothetical protein
MLAAFYERPLGWTRVVDESARPGNPATDGWLYCARQPAGQACHSSTTPDYERPLWPSASGEQQIMMYLDIAIEDSMTQLNKPRTPVPLS